jgi:hypothetical protein
MMSDNKEEILANSIELANINQDDALVSVNDLNNRIGPFTGFINCIAPVFSKLDNVFFCWKDFKTSNRTFKILRIFFSTFIFLISIFSYDKAILRANHASVIDIISLKEDLINLSNQINQVSRLLSDVSVLKGSNFSLLNVINMSSDIKSLYPSSKHNEMVLQGIPIKALNELYIQNVTWNSYLPLMSKGIVFSDEFVSSGSFQTRLFVKRLTAVNQRFRVATGYSCKRVVMTSYQWNVTSECKCSNQCVKFFEQTNGNKSIDCSQNNLDFDITLNNFVGDIIVFFEHIYQDQNPCNPVNTLCTKS